MTDICLILEGTYPYVAGGVSSWVYQLIKEFSEYTFSIVYLGPNRNMSKRLHYEIPKNVVDFREYYLFDYNIRSTRLNPSKEDFETLKTFFMGIKNNNTELFKDLYHLVGDERTRSISPFDLVHSKEIWKIILKMYDEQEESTSFLDFFWTWRFIYLPFLSILRADLPKAKVYHSVSTGYAGMLGVVCKMLYRRPFLLTEHGIYTRERKIEIARAEWIYSEFDQDQKVIERSDFFRDWWIELFSYFSHLIYRNADEIITLFEGNRLLQIEEGAEPDKVKIIPNAVDLRLLKNLSADHEKKKRYTVGFVGRVVPIKDIKTLIVACRQIKDQVDDVEFLIIGPTDEDEEYFKECQILAKTEGMEEEIQFIGKTNPYLYYPKMDVLLLTSISEAQPLSLMEAQACGVPVVATDVGACHELLNGRSADDRLLGKSGMVVPICQPEQIAKCAVQILTNKRLRERLGKIGKRRIHTFYQMSDLVANYRKLYTEYSEKLSWEYTN